MHPVMKKWQEQERVFKKQSETARIVGICQMCSESFDMKRHYDIFCPKCEKLVGDMSTLFD